MNLKPVQIGSSRTLKVGETVFAIGAPQGLELSLSEGIVSSIREEEDRRYIQTTAAISPGSSGGGLFNADGKLVGITAFTFKHGQTLNFALPIEWLNEMPERSEKYKQARKQAAPLLSEACGAAVRKDWEALHDVARKWVSIDKYSANAWTFLAQAHSGMGKYNDAIEAYEHSLQLDASASSYADLGEVYLSRSIQHIDGTLRFDQEDLQKAKNAFEAAIEIEAEYALGWEGLGRVYLSLRNPTRAIQALVHATKYDPGVASYWRFLGNAYHDAGDLEMAIIAHKRAAAIEPDSMSNWLALGMASAKAGRTDLVMEAYSNLRKIDPKVAKGFFRTYVK